MGMQIHRGQYLLVRPGGKNIWNLFILHLLLFLGVSETFDPKSNNSDECIIMFKSVSPVQKGRSSVCDRSGTLKLLNASAFPKLPWTTTNYKPWHRFHAVRDHFIYFTSHNAKLWHHNLSVVACLANSLQWKDIVTVPSAVLAFKVKAGKLEKHILVATAQLGPKILN